MHTLCSFLREYIKHSLLNSFVFMLLLTAIFPILLIGFIESLYELVYFFTALPLALFAIITQIEPNKWLYLIAIFGWVYILFLGRWVRLDKKVCRIQGWYAVGNSILGALMVLGKYY